MSRLVLLHGFTQTSRSWDVVIDRLVPWSCSAVDLPGHGNEPDGARDLWQCADVAVAAGGRGIYVGYSLGARVALHCALAHPDAVTGLVLVSGTPGIDNDDERGQRRRDDDTLADHIEDVGVPAFVDEWLARPLFAGLDEERADRGSRLVNSARGLADSLRHAGTGTQHPLWSRLGEITVPVLLVAGADDDKFHRIALAMAERIDQATLVVVDGCGHSVPFEDPRRFAALLMEWLDDRRFSPGEDQPDREDGGEHRLRPPDDGERPDQI